MEFISKFFTGVEQEITPEKDQPMDPQKDLFERRRKLEEMLEQLPGSLDKGPGTAMKWLRDYADIADNITTTNPDTHRYVAQSFADKGYQSSAKAGGSQFVRDNLESQANDMIGQCLSRMERGKAPNPVMASTLVERHEDQEFKSLIETLPQILQSGNTSKVVDWMQRYADLTDDTHRASGPLHQRVQQTFEQHGYKANAFSGDEYQPGNKEAVGRHIIGQALSSMEKGRDPRSGMINRAVEGFKSMPDQAAPAKPQTLNR